MTDNVCTAVFDMATPMGDLRPDLKFELPAEPLDTVPDWVSSTRQVQGRLCPDDPHFGFVYGRLGVYGADMRVHPQLQKFTADIGFGDRFTDDEPTRVAMPDGSLQTRAMFRIGFKHLEVPGFEAQANERRARRNGAHAPQDPGVLDTNDPHRLILTGQFIRDDVGVWVAAAAHPSTTFADYRKAIGSDFSGDYFGTMENGQPKWWASWVSLVGAGATENVPVMAAAASSDELWAFGSYEETIAASAHDACECNTEPKPETPVFGDDLATVTAERDALAAELAAIHDAAAIEAATQARTTLEAAAAIDWHSELEIALYQQIKTVYGDDVHTWVVDVKVDESAFVFSVEDVTYQQAYSLDDDTVGLVGEPREVRLEQSYEQVT